jgi:hypothetical protein
VPEERDWAPFVHGRPDWLTAGTVHLLVLAAAVVAIEMIPLRLTRGEAVLLVLVGVGAAVALIAWFWLATQRVLDRLPLIEHQERLGTAMLLSVRRIGLPLLGLAFFLAWTFVYVALWAVHPEEAFGGLDAEPRFADFFYYAVATAFTSPPEGIAAGSRGVRAATLIELLTAVALVTTYLSSFVDWRPGARPAEPQAGDRAAPPPADVDEL